MTGPHQQQRDSWSFSTSDGNGKTPDSRVSRRTILLAAGVAVALVVALVTWLVWPSGSASDRAGEQEPVIKPMLNDKPPTMILNEIDVRSLYPPGYVDFDHTKYDPGTDGYVYDPDRDYTETSTVPGCADNPLTDLQYDFDNEDPEHYGNYPITLIMYPIDDPGGNREDERGYRITIFPGRNTGNLDEFRDWYERCDGAVITTTVTRLGQFVEETKRTIDTGVADAPSSEADDAFAEVRTDRESCDFVGLVRGLIVEVSCPPTQKDAGIQLFRTVILRVREM